MARNLFATPCMRKKIKRLLGNSFLILGFFLVFWSQEGGSALGARGLEARILGVREFSTPDYARIVFMLNRETFDFKSSILKKPTRIFIDIPRGRIAQSTRIPKFSPGSSIVSRLRFGKPGKDRLRLVIDIAKKHGVKYRIFTLQNPQRIVVDVWAKTKSISKLSGKGRRERPESGKSTRALRASPRRKKPTRREMNLVQRFRHGLGRIVLDPGHGGRDPGAIGLSGLREKNLALDITLRTRRVLRRVLPGNRIYLTRTTDRYVSLPDRTSFANEHDADIFVSIHVNSARSRRIHGVETYLLSEASSARALRLAARESGTTLARMSDLQKILNDLGLRSKVTESRQLARRVQQAMLSRLRSSYRGVRNLGVKRGPFYVLLGAQMPSILVEVAFISNRSEARRMRSPKYRQALAEGIARGIMRFVGAGSGKAAMNARTR